jgi:hypothetical protein
MNDTMTHSQKKNRRYRTSGIKQQGQSFTEFILLALVLLPLFLLIPMIGKYQDISYSTTLASRYALFAAETRGRTLDTPDRRQYLADNLRRRFFSRLDAPVKTNDVAGNVESDQHPLWKDPQHQALIHDFNDIQLSFGDGTSKRDFKESHDGDPFLLKQPLALEARGIYTVNVDVKLAHLPDGLKLYEPFNHLDLTLHKSASALLNPWTAWSPSNINTHLDKPEIVSTQALQALTPVVQAGVSLLELPGLVTGSPVSAPQFGKLELWDDVIPKDRLSKEAVTPTSQANPSASTSTPQSSSFTPTDLSEETP